MNKNFLNIYNNLIKLTRNKSLYKYYTNKESFSDRLTVFFFHLAFFLKTYKNNSSINDRQKLYDFIFKQIELSIREIGYGDVSVNKKMKDYVNLMYFPLLKLVATTERKQRERLLRLRNTADLQSG